MLMKLQDLIIRPAFSLYRSFSYEDCFDRKFYLRANPDVAAAGMDPLHHYRTYGWREGRNPNRYFNIIWYLSRYQDVARSGIEPLKHFALLGRKEGRQPHHLFDAAYYLHGAPDVAKAGIDPLFHFMRYGDSEGRSPHPLFDPLYYRRSNPEIGSTPPFAHFSEAGARQLRSPCPAFDAEYYSRLYPDSLANRMDPLLHYLLAPTSSRRHFHPLLDGHYQLATSIRSSEGMDPLTDYVQFRSHFAANDLSRGMTSIPAPRPAPLRPRDFIVKTSNADTPKVTIVVPCYKSEPRYLKACVNSIRAQSYNHWELILVDDHSPDDTTWTVLETFRSLDDRIKCLRTPANLGISGCTNVGIGASSGDYIAFVDHDDILTPDALTVMIEQMRNQNADVAYSDQAYCSASGEFEEPFYKPDWSPTLFCGVMYVGHLLIVHADLVRCVGMLDKTYDGCQDFEFMLRVSEFAKKIVHVPYILYHWRRAEGSIASSANAKGPLEPKQAQAANDHLKRRGIRARATINYNWPHRLSIQPTISNLNLVIDVAVQGPLSSAAASESVKSLFAKASGKTGSLDVLRMGSTDTLCMPIGNASFVLFTTRALRTTDTEWLAYLLLHAERRNIGFVAPLLCGEDRRVVAAGLIVNKRYGFLPAHADSTYGDDGYAGSLLCDREVSAVSGVLALVAREKLEMIGGISLQYASLNGAIADASYRATLAGLSNISVAGTHVEVSRSIFNDTCCVIDQALFAEFHNTTLEAGDRYYSRNFNNEAANFRYV
jgi:O-antigen biosynthesis protein